MPKSLLIYPDAGPAPLVEAINSARNSLRIKMFVFDYEPLIEAVIAAHKRGIKTRIMLNPARRSGEGENEETRAKLLAAGVDVKDSNPSFALTHEKSMVVDDTTAFVMSLNWEERNLLQTRDYAIVTHQHDEVAEVLACFDADWDRTEFKPWPKSNLIWSNTNARERFAHFIDNAKHSLWLQNERYQDAVIIERVVRAVTRGVKVHIMARAPHTLKLEKLMEGVGGLRIMQDVGAKVHKLTEIRLHGKMMLADDARAIIGSVNLSPGSFDGRRELALETDHAHVISALLTTVKHDWKDSVEMNLSDAALKTELVKHNKDGGIEGLVLGDD